MLPYKQRQRDICFYLTVERYQSACISFSGITLRFEFPRPIRLYKDFTSFLCEDTAQPDEIIQIRLLDFPLQTPEEEAFSDDFATIYRTDEGWLRIYAPLTAADGCQVACLFCPESNRHTLYYPASTWDRHGDFIRCLHMIAPELILLRRDAFLLHSSVVMMHGKMVLFFGPSGAGKSTQADLWQKYLGAEVINGDRCVVRRREDAFYGSGSPWCGTSDVYRRKEAPISGIFFVNQASENSLQRLRASEAFRLLWAQTLVNSWDPAFVSKLTDIYSDLLSQIPVWRLNCRTDEKAVELVYHTLF